MPQHWEACTWHRRWAAPRGAHYLAEATCSAGRSRHIRQSPPRSHWPSSCCAGLPSSRRRKRKRPDWLSWLRRCGWRRSSANRAARQGAQGGWAVRPPNCACCGDPPHPWHLGVENCAGESRWQRMSPVLDGTGPLWEGKYVCWEQGAREGWAALIQTFGYGGAHEGCKGRGPGQRWSHPAATQQYFAASGAQEALGSPPQSRSFPSLEASLGPSTPNKAERTEQSKDSMNVTVRLTESSTPEILLENIWQFQYVAMMPLKRQWWTCINKPTFTKQSYEDRLCRTESLQPL